MSHNVKFGTYPENVDKKKVEKEWDIYVQKADYQEGASGLPSRIRWINQVLESEEEAYDYIADHDGGWYDCLAVKYKEKKFSPTKAYLELKQRHEEAFFKWNSAKSELRTVKAEFTGCRNCGSKLATKFLKSNKCPVCGTDMRSKTTLDRIARLKSNMDDLKKRMEAEKEKATKVNIRWLLKIEYHT